MIVLKVCITCGRDSILCPLIFTTVSEELDVEELMSFTIRPEERRYRYS